MTKERVTKDYVTQKGTLTGFINIFTPSVKFNENGVYSASILLNEQEGEDILKLVKDLAKEQFKKYGNGKKITEITCIKPLTTVSDEGEEIPDPEHRYILKTGAKAWVKNGVATNKILVADAKRKILPFVSIGKGTVAKLFVTFEGYTTPKETNVTAILKAVQIIHLVDTSMVSIDETGFGIEEDGYEYQGPEDSEQTMSAEEQSDDDEEDF